MRGRHEEPEVMLAYVNLEERVPKDHPLRTIKTVADEALNRLSPEFDRMYSKVGRASVPPERLLKASLLISLYSVRSERAFCEELEYNLLFRWFLDMNLMELGDRPSHPYVRLFCVSGLVVAGRFPGRPPQPVNRWPRPRSSARS